MVLGIVKPCCLHTVNSYCQKWILYIFILYIFGRYLIVA